MERQNAQLIHSATAMLTSAQISFISSVIVSGDPTNGRIDTMSAADTLVVRHRASLMCTHSYCYCATSYLYEGRVYSC